MDKQKSTGKRKKRLVITLGQKIDILKRHARGDANSKIGRDVDMHESTIRNIIKQAANIKEKGQLASTSFGLQTTTRNRSIAMIEMERLLSLWIEECHQKVISLSRAMIQRKALSIFKEVTENENGTKTNETFTASCGWFDRFKHRMQRYHGKMPDEAVSTRNEEVAINSDSFQNSEPEDVINYQRIFNVEGTMRIFKAFYIRRAFTKAIDQTTIDVATSLIDFWNKYNINDAVENIHHTWQEVIANNMRTSSEHILPHSSNDLDGSSAKLVQAVVEEIIDMGRQLGFNQLTTTNVFKLLDSHPEDLPLEDILNLRQQHTIKQEEMDEKDNVDRIQVKEITPNEFEAMFSTLEALKQQVMDIDPCIERSMQVHQELNNVFSKYRQMYDELKNEDIIESKLLKYLRKQ